MLYSARKQTALFCLSLTFAAIAIGSVHAQSVLIPSTTHRDLVFDFAGQNLYISNSTGVVQTWNLSTLTFGPSYDLGGSLNGLDIARDNSFLLVAQNATGASQGAFHRVDLATGSVTNINYTREFGEVGAWDAAIGSNGVALVTTRYGGSGWTPLRQINLATNVIFTRSDSPGSGAGGWIRQDTQIHRSTDGTRFFFMEANISSGPIFTYSALSNTFGPSLNTGASMGSASGAVNRDGSLVALRTGSASLHTAPNLTLVHSFSGIDGGVAFDATFDIFYGVNSTTDQIIAYSTQTFAELFRLNIGENMSAGSTQFGTGTLVASADGRWLALANAVRYTPFPTFNAYSDSHTQRYANTNTNSDFNANTYRYRNTNCHADRRLAYTKLDAPGPSVRFCRTKPLHLKLHGHRPNSQPLDVYLWDEL